MTAKEIGHNGKPLIERSRRMCPRCHGLKSFNSAHCAICARALRPQAHTQTCPTCYRVFQIKKCAAATYCSKACMAKGYEQRLRGSCNPNYRNVLGRLLCKKCQKPIISYNKGRKYCSSTCYQEDPGVSHHRCRKDLNHDEIVSAFKKLGCCVIDLHKVGHGIPDILVGAHKCWHLVEIKNTKQHYGRKGLSQRQRRMNEEMGGAILVVTTLDDVQRLCNEWRVAASALDRGIKPAVQKVRTEQEALTAIGATR